MFFNIHNLNRFKKKHKYNSIGTLSLVLVFKINETKNMFANELRYGGKHEVKKFFSRFGRHI
jgi:hypothetical protein